VYEICEICDGLIRRDVYFAASDPEPVGFWLGVCGCAERKWRWLSTTDDGPWELVDGDSLTETVLAP